MTGRMLQMSGVVVDMVYRVDAVPLAGQEADVRGAALSVGGGFNAMVAARRAGMEVAFAGTLGRGPLAQMVDNALTAEGIAHVGARCDTRDQGCCTVLVDNAGERTFIGLPGADGQVCDADLVFLQLGSDDWILQSGYALFYPGSTQALSRWLLCRPAGTRLIFDPGPRVAAIPSGALDAALGAALWVSANAAEAAVLSGAKDPEHAVRILAEARPEAGGAVVRDGANGGWLAQPDRAPRHIPAHRVAAIDTNGAGDTHIGYFISMLAGGHDPEVALRAANIAAALSTTTEGPSTAPPLAQVLAMMPAASQPPLQQG